MQTEVYLQHPPHTSPNSAQRTTRRYSGDPIVTLRCPSFLVTKDSHLRHPTCHAHPLPAPDCPRKGVAPRRNETL